MGMHRLWWMALLVWLGFVPGNALAAVQFTYSGEAWTCPEFASGLGGFCNKEDRVGGVYPIKLQYELENPDAVVRFFFEFNAGFFQNLNKLTSLNLYLPEEEATILGVRKAIVDYCINQIGLPEIYDDCSNGNIAFDMLVEGASGRVKGTDQFLSFLDVDVFFDMFWSPKGGRGTYSDDCCNPCSQVSFETPGGSCSFVFFATVPEPGARESIATAIAFLLAYQARRRYRDWLARS